jgi:phosphate starvation-inducible PhoH-like protein
LTEITIPLRSHEEAAFVLGPYDRWAKLLRQDLEIDIYTRRGNLRITGPDDGVSEARRRIEHLLGKKRKGRELALREIEAILMGGEEASASAPAAVGGRSAGAGGRGGAQRAPSDGWPATERGAGAPRTFTPAGPGGRGGRVAAIQPRTETQRRYLDAIEHSTLTFGLGVAGTGKTFLAVTAAMRALRAGRCRRLVITRPVVEAGERLGFLPGDLQAKLNPYMRPIYDSMYDLVGFEDVGRLEELGVIEVAPLAYMRGRTLSDAFVILDEAQNTTVGQMKMFLTRLGEGSRMVVTGDPTQTDLESDQKSGLNDAVRRLRGFEDVAVVEFGPKDIVRNPLVERIVRAYEPGGDVRRGRPREGGERERPE